MNLFRLAKSKYANDLTGRGAFLFGGRWNIPGVYALYTATNSSLAFLEILANVSSVDDIPNDLLMLKIELEENSNEIHYLTFEDLPHDWNEITYDYDIQKFGSKEISNSAAVVFPSVVMRWDYNVVLNPLYPGFEKIIKSKSVHPFKIDSRIRKLFGK